jgi:hypothetical protein
MAKVCSAGSDTPQNKLLLGITPRGTTIEYTYLCEFEIEFKNILGCVFGACMGSIDEKSEAENLVLLFL